MGGSTPPSGAMRTPDETRPLHGGTQRIYRFANGYSASVVEHDFSYGQELAVQYDGKIVYDTPITDDVIGHLTDEEREGVLDQIEALPAREEGA